MAKMICVKSKAKAKSIAKHRRAGGKKAHIKAKKGGYCVVSGGKKRKARRSRKSKR